MDVNNHCTTGIFCCSFVLTLREGFRLIVKLHYCAESPLWWLNLANLRSIDFFQWVKGEISRGDFFVRNIANQWRMSGLFWNKKCSIYESLFLAWTSKHITKVGEGGGSSVWCRSNAFFLITYVCAFILPIKCG